MTTPHKINFPPPKLQIDFAFALKRFRAVYLQSALLENRLLMGYIFFRKIAEAGVGGVET